MHPEMTSICIGFSFFIVKLKKLFFFVAFNSFFRSRTYLFSFQQSDGPLKATKQTFVSRGPVKLVRAFKEKRGKFGV